MPGARPLSLACRGRYDRGRDMAGRVEGYRAELRALHDWEPFLKKHSGLPGARANLELVEAVGEEADADRLWRMSASTDEFVAICGTAGLGKVALMGPATVMTWLKELASDPRWRGRRGGPAPPPRIRPAGLSPLLGENARGYAGGTPRPPRR